MYTNKGGKMEEVEVVEKDYLTPGDVAQKLGVHENTVRMWCEKGTIGSRVGSRWRITPDELVKVAPGYVGKAS